MNARTSPEAITDPYGVSFTAADLADPALWSYASPADPGSRAYGLHTPPYGWRGALLARRPTATCSPRSGHCSPTRSPRSPAAAAASSGPSAVTGSPPRSTGRARTAVGRSPRTPGRFLSSRGRLLSRGGGPEGRHGVRGRRRTRRCRRHGSRGRPVRAGVGASWTVGRMSGWASTRRAPALSRRGPDEMGAPIRNGAPGLGFGGPPPLSKRASSRRSRRGSRPAARPNGPSCPRRARRPYRRAEWTARRHRCPA